MNLDDVLVDVPVGLRTPLLKEYRQLVLSYSERRWAPSEMSGGRFCEVVYTVLVGYATDNWPQSPAKPQNFVHACRKLECNSHVPRSMRILIPRLLVGLYEIRNNRGVGHVGGDVDPNIMDASAVLNISSFIMAELVRVFHNVTIDSAQRVVDALAEHRHPAVWRKNDTRRVLDTSLKLKDQALLLISSSTEPVSLQDLQAWLEYDNRSYLTKVLRDLHKARLVEMSPDGTSIELLPPGTTHIQSLLGQQMGK